MDAGIALSQSTDTGADVGKLLDQEKTELYPLHKNVESTMAQKAPQPNLQEAPKKPEFTIAQDATEWTGILSVLSGLGGAVSRQHATTAMNAFASGMDGFKQGKFDAVKQAQEQWKDANQAVVENNKAQVEAYKAALSDKKSSIDEQMANIKTIASQYHNDIMGQMAEARNYTAVARVMDMMQDQNDKLKLAYDKLSGNVASVTDVVDAAHKAVSDYQEKYVDPATGQPKPGAPSMNDFVKEAVSKVHGTAGGNSDEAIDQMAEGLYKGMTPAQLGLSTRTTNNPTLAKVRNRLAVLHPDFDYEKAALSFAGDKAGATAVGRQTGTIQLASNILDESLPSLMESAKKVGLSPSTDLNTVLNTLKSHGSDQDLNNFRTQLRAVTTDYAQFIGRGRQTVHSDEEALKILKDNGGITSLQGFEDAVKTEQKNVSRGIDKTKNGGSSDSAPAASSGASGAGNDDPLGLR